MTILRDTADVTCNDRLQTNWYEGYFDCIIYSGVIFELYNW